MGFGRDVRAAIFHRVGSFSQREVQDFGAPSLITRETNDVQQVQMLVLMSCTLMVMAPIMMVGGIFMAMHVDLGLSWLIVVTVPVLAVAMALIITRMVPSFRLMQTRIDEVNRLLREQITGVRVVRAFVREDRETERFATANGELTDVATRAGRYLAAMFPAVMLVANVASVARALVRRPPGRLRRDAGRCPDGVPRLPDADRDVGDDGHLHDDDAAAGRRLRRPRHGGARHRDLRAAAGRAGDRPPAARHARARRRRARRTPARTRRCCATSRFRAEPGQTVAVIGSTGAGKSTLVNLVPRLFDVTAGELRVDGVDVRRLDPERLWSVIGLVPQKRVPVLRHRPLQPDARQAGRHRRGDVGSAGDRAGRRLRARDGPEGGASTAPIAQGGTNVSGGQRQRLAIARAVVKRPEIYLFDDSFSALDLATDARLRAALRPVTREATVLIVAQRVSTIRDADLILVLEDGVIVDRGTHQRAARDVQTYQEIVASQLSAEEAA